MSFRALRLRSERGLGMPQRADLRANLRDLILNAQHRIPSSQHFVSSARYLIPGAARELSRKLPKPAGRIPRPLRSLGMRCVLGLSGLLVAMAAWGQSSQPWSGSGIAVPQVATPVTAGARAVQMVGLTVSDMNRSVDFFTQVLDFTRISDDEVAGPAYDSLENLFGARLRVVRLRLGDELLQLTQYVRPEGRPFPANSRSNDRWFQHVAIIVSDMDRAYARLRQFHVRHASTAPQLLPRTIPNAAGIRAFYFRDPDGHFLEILQFPPDKGDPKWHQPGGPLFLGIDHTAIVVRQTEQSLRFYRNALGLRVAGESMNFGAEQEHLNNVKGARLHITGLRTGRGPGIEFLEYLAPTDGRPYPAGERANDLVHWETTIVVPSVDSAAGVLQREGFRLLTPRPIELPDSTLGFRRGILARDPDGHVVQLVES